jgi:aryl-alcohol dehydrogenase-like predicted oxidoreductase
LNFVEENILRDHEVIMVLKLPTRQLGKNGPQVTALGYGTMGLSAYYFPAAPDAERLQFLDYVYNSGMLNWDTSDVYGDSEDLLGKWFVKNEKRDEIFLATKGGGGVDEEGKAYVRSDPDYVKDACNRSLGRLKVDHVDLYYIHRLDKVTPIEKTVAAMVELKNEGKIRYLGLSECSANTLRRA